MHIDSNNPLSTRHNLIHLSIELIKHKPIFGYGVGSFQDVLTNEIGVMDSTAIALCKDNKIPIVVFNIFEPGNIAKAISGNQIGSRISNSS